MFGCPLAGKRSVLQVSPAPRGSPALGGRSAASRGSSKGPCAPRARVPGVSTAAPRSPVTDAPSSAEGRTAVVGAVTKLEVCGRQSGRQEQVQSPGLAGCAPGTRQRREKAPWSRLREPCCGRSTLLTVPPAA